jgi:hypothetical protein
MKQRDAKPAFQRLDGVADRACREVQLAGCFLKAVVPGSCLEDAQRTGGRRKAMVFDPAQACSPILWSGRQASPI